MVYTRSGRMTYNNRRQQEEYDYYQQQHQNFDNYFFQPSDNESEEECEECSQNNNTPANHISSIYRPNDNCHRHRKPDNDPYTETVTTYKRRKNK